MHSEMGLAGSEFDAARVTVSWCETHIYAMEVHTPVGPCSRGDEAVPVLTGRGERGVGRGQCSHDLSHLLQSWTRQIVRTKQSPKKCFFFTFS